MLCLFGGMGNGRVLILGRVASVSRGHVRRRLHVAAAKNRRFRRDDRQKLRRPRRPTRVGLLDRQNAPDQQRRRRRKRVRKSFCFRRLIFCAGIELFFQHFS
jgi:hypothetical protein